MTDKKALVLIVDDDESLLELIKMALNHNDFDVITATNGQDAIKKVQQHHPTLIVLDVMMPIMDGYEACKFLKSQAEFKHIPIIMLTAKGHEKDFEQGKQAGADEFITKPFDFNDFLEILNQFLKKQREKEEASIN